MQKSNVWSGYAEKDTKGNHRRMKLIDGSVSWGYGKYP